MGWREPCERCGRTTACPHYPAYADGFPQRVELAAQCYRTGDGIGSRAFDNCFEMSDGAFVVAALDRRAARDPALRAGIYRQLSSPTAQAQWSRTVASLEHLRDDQLQAAAARQRASAHDAAEWQGQGSLAL